jgi:hypothetical protein
MSYHTKVYLMHGVAHEHLVNTELEMLNHPERIEQKMCFAIFSSLLIITGPGRTLGGFIFVPRHDGLSGAARFPSLLTPRIAADIGLPTLSRLGTK